MLTDNKYINWISGALLIIWIVIMVGVGIKACVYVKEARADTSKSKNYTVKDNNGNVRYRVHCEYGNCVAYDSKWYPEYRWQDTDSGIPDDVVDYDTFEPVGDIDSN